jgi:hypothetical protein
MTKQELLKQADYTFQRGNRELAKKYLADFLAQYPQEESAWMLMARIEEDVRRKIECYERTLKINPGNNEAKIWIARLKSPSKTLPLPAPTPQSSIPRPAKNLLRWTSVFAVLAILFGGTSYVVARKNPDLAIAKLMPIAIPTKDLSIPITGDVAQQTRAEMSAKYPEYAALLDTLIGFAVNGAQDGLNGAPERPGAKILPSDAIGKEAQVNLEQSIPKPGTLSTFSLTERELTSWLAMEMKNNQDLPLSDIQVYLRDNKIQLWGMVKGSSDSTSALIVGNLVIDSNNKPSITVESMQIGTKSLPDALASQMQSWLNQFLLDEIEKNAPGLEIMSVNISNGMITVSGMR